MLSSAASRKSWICQVLPLLSVGTLQVSEIKFLIRNFTEALVMNFIPDWESEIISQYKDKLVRKLMLLSNADVIAQWRCCCAMQMLLRKCRCCCAMQVLSRNADGIAQKWELFRKTNFTEGFFPETGRNHVRRRKVYKKTVVIQNSAIRYNNEFHVRSHKD